MQQLDETLARVVRLLARAHDLLSEPLVHPVSADISRPVAADLVEDAYLLTVEARARYQQQLAREMAPASDILKDNRLRWTAAAHVLGSRV